MCFISKVYKHRHWSGNMSCCITSRFLSCHAHLIHSVLEAIISLQNLKGLFSEEMCCLQWGHIRTVGCGLPWPVWIWKVWVSGLGDSIARERRCHWGRQCGILSRKIYFLWGEEQDNQEEDIVLCPLCVPAPEPKSDWMRNWRRDTRGTAFHKNIVIETNLFNKCFQSRIQNT